MVLLRFNTASAALFCIASLFFFAGCFGSSKNDSPLSEGRDSENKPNKLAGISEKQPDNGATVRFPFASPDAKEEDLVHIAADQYGGEIHCIAVSDNEKLLAYGGWGPSVTLVDVSTRNQVAQLSAHLDEKIVTTLAFSPDSQLLATASIDEDCVKLWDMSTFKEITEIKEGRDIRVTTIAFSKDGSLLAGGGGGKVWIWDREKQKVVFKSDLSDCPVYAVAISPDGKLLAAGGGYRDPKVPGVIKVWDIANGRLKYEFKKEDGAIHWVAFGDHPENLVSGEDNGTVALWNMEKGTFESIKEGNNELHRFSISDDRKMLAIGGWKGNIEILTIDGPIKRRSLKVGEDIRCLYLSKSKQFLAIGFSKGKGIELMRLGSKNIPG